MAFMFQGRSSVSWRRRMFRVTKHQQNDRNFEKIWELIHEDCRQTIHELADTAGISYRVCQEILTENLNMRCTAAKSVPRLVTNDQKQQHVNECLELREKANEDPTFTHISRIIKGDENWIYGYNPETKQQLSRWKSPQSPRAKKMQQVQSSSNSKLIVFFFFSNWKGLFTVNSFLLTLWSTLTFTVTFWDTWGKMHDKWPELWHNHDWLLHHDVPAHTSLKTTEFVTNNNMVIVPTLPTHQT
jgi:hypothetical protein